MQDIEPNPILELRDAQTPSHRLLCIEDNPANLLLIQQLLERRNDLKLFTAIDAEQGIQLARTCRPDSILMDLRLPRINGFEAMKILRGDTATTHIPVIAMSSNAFPGEIKRCLDAGFFEYLTKPFHLDELMNVIDAALAHAMGKRPT